MQIQKQPTKITITFDPAEYWLRRNAKNPDWQGEYCLTHRIDMSYKGKDDQEGSVVMYLSDEQAKEFRQAGFSEIEGGTDPTTF